MTDAEMAAASLEDLDARMANLEMTYLKSRSFTEVLEIAGEMGRIQEERDFRSRRVIS